MSEKKEATRVLDWIGNELWAITDEGLDQVISLAKRELDVEAYEAKTGKPLEYTRSVTVRDGVAIIPIEGPIAAKANIFTRISGGTSLQDLALDFTTANENPDVRAIIMAIDSPGGTAHGPGDIAKLIRNRKGSKSVVAYGGGAAVASAAYWLAAAADKRYGSPTSYWGSLGSLISAKGKVKRGDGAGASTAEDFQFIYSKSPKKRADPETPEGQAQIQTWVDDIGDVFIESVASLLNVPVSKVLSDFGQGDLMIASKAQAAGMIDGVATFEEVLANLATPARKGISIAPRVAAKTTTPTASAKERGMSVTRNEPDATGEEVLAQLAAANERLAAMEKQNAVFQAAAEESARLRIKAEVAQFCAGLLASGNLGPFNPQNVAALGHLQLIAKCAAEGISSITITAADKSERTITLDPKSIGALVAEQVAVLAAAAPKFEVPTAPLATPSANAGAPMTLAEYNNASYDSALGAKVQAIVNERRKTNPKYSTKDLRRELIAQAGN